MSKSPMTTAPVLVLALFCWLMLSGMGYALIAMLIPLYTILCMIFNGVIGRKPNKDNTTDDSSNVIIPEVVVFHEDYSRMVSKDHLKQKHRFIEEHRKDVEDKN